MRRIFRFFLSTPFLILFFAAVIAASVWFLGPVMGIAGVYPFETLLARILTVAGLFLFAIILILIVLLRRAARERRLEEDIASGPAEDPADAAARAEIEEVRTRMREALGHLRRSRLGGRFGRKHLYQLPWYIMIGPSGAGKTTAIVKSGLQFPLADRMGITTIGGVGGTRNCDWLFTNEAVLIDTAGRYTLHDSDATADSQAWTGFLDMLKRTRKRQPINGAIIAISLSDLSLLDEATRRTHAAAIRKRLSELRERLGVRFPVYVLFTKADLIAGFQEFFEPLGKEGREQVWGFTLKLPARGEAGSALAGFETEFESLLSRLNDQVLERMQAETNTERRSLIQAFPGQVASLREVARDFLGEVFQDSRFEDRQLLRGVYFTSGTQEGTPIDRLMMGMARTFGIGRQAIGSGQGQPRSYFLNRLLGGVIFREAGLVSADDKVERRYRWVVRGGIAAALAVLVVTGALWTVSYIGNRALVAEARAEVERYQEAVAGIRVNPVEDRDLDGVLPALNILRDMPGNPAQADPDPPIELTWGLYQGDAIGNEAAQTYRSALNRLMLPRLLVRLEELMVANRDNPDFLFETLKAYLMLGLQGPMDREFLAQFLALDWEVNLYPGDRNADLRADLAGHLDRMLSQRMAEIKLNGTLVEQTQRILSQTSLAERIYRSIISSPEAQALDPWRVINAGGPATGRVIVRPSGQPLSAGVPGIYTYRGFHRVFLPAASEVATRITRESWILGDYGAEVANESNLPNIARDVIGLYYSDYIGEWNRILGDLDIVQISSMADAVRVVNDLSGPASPIANLLRSVSEETRLTEDRNAVDLQEATEGTAELAVTEAVEGLSLRTQALIKLLRQASPGVNLSQDAEAPPGQPVDIAFDWLHQFTVGRDDQPSELDLAIDRFGKVYDELNRLSRQGRLQLTPDASGATEELLIASDNLPDPMRRWARQVAGGGTTILAGGKRETLNGIWRQQVLPVCQAVQERYPLNPGSRNDVGLQDFAKLFAPNGEIDRFFNDHLQDYVDTAGTSWRFLRQPGRDLGIPDDVLEIFQMAAKIRDAFFIQPGMPKINFDITPFALDPGATQVILELEGQKVDYAHGPVGVTTMTWPGPGGRTRVTLMPETPGTSNQITADGPWALFRLLDRAQKRRTQTADQFKLIFIVGGRQAIFDLRAGSAFNPFDLPELTRFRCPQAL